MIAAGIVDLGNQIEDKFPYTKVNFSSLIVRKDKTSVLHKFNINAIKIIGVI